MCHLSVGGEDVRDAENFGDEANFGQDAEGRTILRLRGLLDNSRSGEDQGSFDLAGDAGTKMPGW